jgi:hypothetical protein
MMTGLLGLRCAPQGNDTERSYLRRHRVRKGAEETASKNVLQVRLAGSCLRGLTDSFTAGPPFRAIEAPRGSRAKRVECSVERVLVCAENWIAL